VPRDDRFFRLFEEAAQNIIEGARLFRATLEDPQRVEANARRMKEIEEKGDAITHDVFHKLYRTYVTPIDQEDIHALASRLDDVIDMIEAAAARLELYRVREIPEDARELAAVIERQAEELLKAVQCLGRRQYDRIHTHIVEVNRLENEGDRLLRHALGELFGSGADALEVLKWKELYESLESVTDCSEEAAIIIEGVVMKHA